MHPGQVLERAVERQQLFIADVGRSAEDVVEGDDDVGDTAPFGGMTAARRLDQDLPHGPGSDALEMEV